MPIGHGGHLENIFFASSPKTKSQFTPNLVGSIGVTYRSKIDKFVSIGIRPMVAILKI